MNSQQQSSGSRSVCKDAASDRAFTLTEMLLVLLIIGIMVGGVVVSIHGRRASHELRIAAKDLAAGIRYAKHQAATTGIDHRAHLSIDRLAFVVEKSSKSDPPHYLPVRGAAGQSHSLPANIEIDVIANNGSEELATNGIIDFRSDGSGFSGMIYLKNASGGEVVIEVIPGTGQVVVSVVKEEQPDEYSLQ